MTMYGCLAVISHKESHTLLPLTWLGQHRSALKDRKLAYPPCSVWEFFKSRAIYLLNWEKSPSRWAGLHQVRGNVAVTAGCVTGCQPLGPKFRVAAGGPETHFPSLRHPQDCPVVPVCTYKLPGKGTASRTPLSTIRACSQSS